MENLNKKTNVNIREVVFSNKKENSFCDVFVYEPENIEEQTLGNLYIVSEIINLSENSSYLVNLLSSVIKKEFYSNSKRGTMESFEESLHKANSVLSDIAEQGNVSWVGSLNMVCGAYKNRELYISQVGKVKTLLIRNGKITDIGKSITSKEKPHPFRTFANIASGEAEEEDLILFSTQEFSNIFSLEKIRQLAASLEIDEFAETIQNCVDKEENIETFGLLIMKIEREKKDKSKEISHIKIESESENFIKTQDQEIQENKELTSVREDSEINKKSDNQHKNIEKEVSKGINLEDIIREYDDDKEDGLTEIFKDDGKDDKNIEKLDRIAEFASEFNQNREKREIEESKEEKSKKEEFSDFLGNITENQKIKSFFETVKTSIRNFSHIVKNKIVIPFMSFLKKFTKDGIAFTSLMLHKVNPVVKSAKSKKKIILTVFIAALFILAMGLSREENKNESVEKSEFFNENLILAEEKLNKAEDVMIYNDFIKARELLSQAKSLASDVNEKTKNGYDELYRSSTDILNKIQKNIDIIDSVERIDNPKVILNLKDIGISDPQNVINIGKDYYIFSSSENALYKTNLDGKKIEKIKMNINEVGHLKFSTFMDSFEEIVFLTDLNKIVKFDAKREKFSKISIKLSNNVPNIKDINSYNNYIYILDLNSEQIYKHRRTTSGFGSGKLWIEDADANLENAVSIAIDGFIYVLKKNGTVEKYLTGNRVDFSIESPSETISSPTKIYTKSWLKHIYIIDPQKNRIILFEKDSGKLVRQYTSDEFTNLKDIFVDKNERKMGVLSKEKMFEIKIKFED